MYILVDLIILFIFIACIFVGYKRGLVELAVNCISLIASIIIAFILLHPITNYVISNTNYYYDIKNYIITVANENINVNNESGENSNTSSNTNAPELLVQYINKSIQNATNEVKDTVIDSVADTISRNTICIAVFICLFVILRIALLLLKLVSSTITELPIIKQLDKSGGVVYGILEAFLIIYITLAIIAIFIKSIALENAINNSYIGSILYNNNLILNIFF